MKVLLMHPDRDFDAQRSSTEPIQFAHDLEIGVLLNTASSGDKYLYDTMTTTFACAWTNDAATIRYRQEILKDCLANPLIVRQLYEIALEPFSRERSWDFSLHGWDASSMVRSGTETLKNCLDVLGRLRAACLSNRRLFVSKGFLQFFDTLEREINEKYLEDARSDLKHLRFRRGLLISAHVGDGGKAVGTMLCKPQARDLNWIRRALTPGAPSLTLQLHPRDDAGAQAFREFQNTGLSLIADAVYQSAEHVRDYLRTLRAELAFYIACLNLHEQLHRIGETIAFPQVSENKAIFRAKNLRDVCLALTIGRPPAGNDIDADKKQMVIITGANRGGKSTFLRSVGIAQLLLQSGMFVTCDYFVSSIRSGLFTHYKRREDRNMHSGKFDEELVRMSDIADNIRHNGLVLFNESFAATHELEGAEIARQIVSALLDNDVLVFFVSHMYQFARAFLDDGRVLFLRADRSEDGSRNFRLHEAKPLQTSFAIDLYERIFQRQPHAAATGAPPAKINDAR